VNRAPGLGAGGGGGGFVFLNRNKLIGDYDFTNRQADGIAVK